MPEENKGALLVFGTMLLCDLVSAILVVLKLRKIIDWSWLWVTAPFWGQFVVIAVLALISVITCGVIGIINKKRK